MLMRYGPEDPVEPLHPAWTISLSLIKDGPRRSGICTYSHNTLAKKYMKRK
jgi:hypothetical protein